MKRILLFLLFTVSVFSSAQNATINFDEVEGYFNISLQGATQYNGSDWMKGNLQNQSYQDQHYDTCAANLIAESGIRLIRLPISDFSRIFAYPDSALNYHAINEFGLPDTFGLGFGHFSLVDFFRLCEDKDIKLLLSIEGSFFGSEPWDPITNNLYCDSTDYQDSDSFIYSGERYYYYQYEIDKFAKPFMQIFHFLYGDPSSSDSLEAAWASLRACSTYVSELGTYVGYNHPEPLDNNALLCNGKDLYLNY